MRRLLMIGIKGYQWVLSPLWPAQCRFRPTCSEYALEAVQRHGAWRGGLLGARRICSCHPFGRSGFDPVPPVFSSSSKE